MSAAACRPVILILSVVLVSCMLYGAVELPAGEAFGMSVVQQHHYYTSTSTRYDSTIPFPLLIPISSPCSVHH